MGTKTTLAVRLVTRVTRVSLFDSPKTFSLSASCHNRLFQSSPYFCVNKVFICDLLRARFRVSESCGLQVINNLLFQSVTNVMVMVKVGECPTF